MVSGAERDATGSAQRTGFGRSSAGTFAEQTAAQREGQTGFVPVGRPRVGTASTATLGEAVNRSVA
jgi:hypothetical protein